jgi:hypothetical protein
MVNPNRLFTFLRILYSLTLTLIAFFQEDSCKRQHSLFLTVLFFVMRIFKYLSPIRIDVIRKQQIRFTQPKYFNDPFEHLPNMPMLMNDDVFEKILGLSAISSILKPVMQPAIEEIIGQINQKLFPIEQADIIEARDFLNAMQDPDINNAFKNAMTVEGEHNFGLSIRDKIDVNIGVLNLTKRNDNLSMWAHYAQEHSGFVIEFDPDSPFFQYPESIFNVFKTTQIVKYLTRRPVVVPFLKANRSNKWIEKLAESIFLTKSIDWKLEEELRLVRLLKHLDTCAILKIQQIHFKQFKPSLIKNIFLGAQCSDDFENKMKRLLRQKRYAHVGLYRGVISPTEYQINFNLIERADW